MLWFAVGFLLGDCVIQVVPALPTLWPYGAVLVVAAALAALARRVFLCSLVCGASWTLLAAHSILAQRLPANLEGEELEMLGAIASIPSVTDNGLQFIVETEAPSPGIPPRVQLSWFDTTARVTPGDVWRLHVKLRRPRGFANPGGLDYERQLLTERIGATGYVRESSDNRRVASFEWRYSVLRTRAAIAERLSEAVGSSSMSGLMRGLAVGDQQAIAADAWRVFANTGTTHLVAISGFHIGVVATLFGVLCGGCARLPAAQRWRWSRVDARAVGTIVGGVLYSALAGFSIPTQRTLVMLCVYFGMRLLRRCVAPWHSLALALIGVLLVDPLAPLAVGFWLSFVAVAVILLAVDGQLTLVSKVREHVRMQIVVTIGLAPVLIAAFGNISLIAPCVNLLAIPFFSLLVVPGVLSGVLLLWIWQPAGSFVLTCTAHLLEWTWPALEWCAHLPLAMVYFPERPWWMLLLAFAGAAFWALPIAPLRAAGLALCTPALVIPSEKLEPGVLELAALDVGQGLAVVVRTRGHTLIYDTGPAFRSGRDTGEFVVVPYLHSLGLTRADVLMLSHGDLDHVGGAKSVRAAIAVMRIIQGPSVHPLGSADVCVAGQRWQWDGVDFAVLHPSDPHELARNDSSCVLEIRSGNQRALIMGDVERSSELALVQRAAIAQTGIVIAAHHGSGTSSTEPFVAATHARYVVFSAGWRNRWDFPKPDVVQRWQEQGAKSYTTFHSGAVTFDVTPRAVSRVREYRMEHRYYWSAGES